MIRMFGGTPHFAGGWESTPSGNYSYSNATGFGAPRSSTIFTRCLQREGLVV